MYEFIFKNKVETICLFHLIKLIAFFSRSENLIQSTIKFYNTMKVLDKFKKKIDFLK
jgi:hypothetical protein